jgi:prolyl 4-hydroxylase
VTDFIGRYYLKNHSVCDKAIDWFERNKDKASEGKIISSKGEVLVDDKVKCSDDIKGYLSDFYQLGDEFKTLLDFLWGSVQNYISEYSELASINFHMPDVINFQKYTPPLGGYKIFHYERPSRAVSNRCLVWMIYLNTVEAGGGTEFKYYKHTEKAEKGKLLIWPPDFTHTHRGIPSPTEVKYILTGWYDLY